MSFIENDGILKETLPFHTNKTDLNWGLFFFYFQPFCFLIFAI
jgi:hypothetical protein